MNIWLRPYISTCTWSPTTVRLQKIKGADSLSEYPVNVTVDDFTTKRKKGFHRHYHSMAWVANVAGEALAHEASLLRCVVDVWPLAVYVIDPLTCYRQ